MDKENLNSQLERKINWPLIASILASSMAFIDGSALNVALTALEKNLHATGNQILWIVNGYNLPVSALILLGGALGDRYGIKKVFSLGIIIFLAASVLCGVAPTANLLIIARVIQGLGGALLIPSSLSYLTLSTPENNRGKTIGFWSAFSTLTTILGPVLGGLLAGGGLWRAVFLINVPLGLFALWVLNFKDLQKFEGKLSLKIDYGGAFLIIAALGLLSGGLLASGQKIIEHGMVGLSVIFFVGFLFFEKNHDSPMLPLSIFKSRSFTGVNLMTLLLYSTLAGVLLFVPLNLIQIQNYPDSLAGVASLPFAMMVILLSPVAGRLLDKNGPRILLTLGPLIVGGGFASLSLIGLTSGMNSYWTTFFPAYVLLGLGMALTIAPLTTTVMNILPESQAGLASGVNNAAARVAGVLAVAILGNVFMSLFVSGMHQKLASLGLNQDQMSYMSGELAHLGTARIPSEWQDHIKEVLRSDIRVIFVRSFRTICLLGSGLCVLSAGTSYLLVENRVKFRSG